jgi:thiamine-phosphate pyrophosphorylase
MNEHVPSGIDVFYPIVPDARWLARLVPLGIRTIQLRIKEAVGDDIRKQIAESLEVTRRHGCQLIVNDYWREAMDAGADYVHLGQEDLAAADVDRIRRAGLRIGISTHSEEELATALAARPAYVALGPIYETKLKAMRWAPQGLERVAGWKRQIGNVPLVAIGGITPERATGIIAAGAQSVAVITDFMTAQDPAARIALWLQWAEEARRAASATVATAPDQPEI